MKSNPGNTIEEDQRAQLARALDRLRAGLVVRFEPGRVIIEDLAAKDLTMRHKPGAAGLWKWIGGPEKPRRVFEVPAWCVSLAKQEDPDDLELSGPLPLERYVDWAAATRSGLVPGDWTTPSSDLVHSWIRAGELTVRSRGCLRQVELVLDELCWALRLALAPLSPELPRARREALAALADDIENRLAMVRVVLDNSTPAMLMAEVCLSGGPASDLLFSTGLDALRHAAGLVETAEVLSDASLRIACLADAEITTKPQKGEHHVDIGA